MEAKAFGQIARSDAIKRTLELAKEKRPELDMRGLGKPPKLLEMAA
jgi:hypothetical protein